MAKDYLSQLKGNVTIRVEGFFIERFLNLCMNRGIEVWNIKRLNDAELTANIKHKDYKEVSYHENFTAPTAKILVVDDNEMNLMVVKSLLKQTQVQITTCLNGVSCLKYFSEETYDIVLLDHMMPELDGVETFRIMKQMEEYPSKAFVFLK